MRLLIDVRLDQARQNSSYIIYVNFMIANIINTNITKKKKNDNIYTDLTT